MFENCVINFRVIIFSWSGATTKIYYHKNLFTDIRKWKITKGISVFAASCVYDIWEAAVAYLPMSAQSLEL